MRSLSLILTLVLAACGGGGEPTSVPDTGPCAGFEVTHLPEVDHEQGMFALRDSRTYQYLVDGTGTVFTTARAPTSDSVQQCANSIAVGRAYSLVVLNSNAVYMGSGPLGPKS